MLEHTSNSEDVITLVIEKYDRFRDKWSNIGGLTAKDV